MALFIVIQSKHPPYNDIRYYRVKTNGYRQILSASAFMDCYDLELPNNEILSTFKDNKEKQIIDDFIRISKLTGDIFDTLDISDNNSPKLKNVTEFDSIWDFYNHINWDYKKKRFKKTN